MLAVVMRQCLMTMLDECLAVLMAGDAPDCARIALTATSWPCCAAKWMVRQPPSPTSGDVNAV